MMNKKIGKFDFIEQDIHLNLLNPFQCQEEGSYKTSLIQMGCFSPKTRGSFTLPENKSSCEVDQEVYAQTLPYDLSQDRTEKPGGTQNKIGTEKWDEYPLWLIFQHLNFNDINSLLVNDPNQLTDSNKCNF